MVQMRMLTVLAGAALTLGLGGVALTQAQGGEEPAGSPGVVTDDRGGDAARDTRF